MRVIGIHSQHLFLKKIKMNQQKDLESKISKYIKSKEILSKQLSEYKKIENEIESTELKLTLEKENFEKIKNLLTSLNTKIENQETKRNEIESEFTKISELGEKSECPTCNRSLEDHLPVIKKHYQSELKKIEKIVNKLKEQEKILLDNKSSIVDLINNFEKILRNLIESNIIPELQQFKVKNQIINFYFLSNKIFLHETQGK